MLLLVPLWSLIQPAQLVTLSILVPPMVPLVRPTLAPQLAVLPTRTKRVLEVLQVRRVKRLLSHATLDIREVVLRRVLRTVLLTH